MLVHILFLFVLKKLFYRLLALLMVYIYTYNTYVTEYLKKLKYYIV